MSERHRATRTGQPRDGRPSSPTSAERKRLSNGTSPDQKLRGAVEDSPGKIKAQSLPLLRYRGAASVRDTQATGSRYKNGRTWYQSVWTMSLLTFLVTSVGVALLYSVLSSAFAMHCDTKGCRMSYMRPAYYRFDGFDTEHTRFASKYSLYLYREQGVDYDHKVSGIPVLFIPGNAGSYKQVRPIAAESASYYHEVLRHDPVLAQTGVKNLDFFSVDFNEDFTAFHGQTMLDQAEYLNEAVRYILSLYSDPNASRRDPRLPDPTSVIILGHSMGGIVARTMLVMPNYQAASINTIVTMSTPHARPPVTFDSQIVKIYTDINGYWRQSFAANQSDSNPLRDITLISIAGGGLDTVVPSDYAGLESILPETHGFTVFTSSIPNVWTSMDHQAIMWCDQFRKVIAKTLLEIVDNRGSSQTKPLNERMLVFKKWLLTGMEKIAEKTARSTTQTTLLTLNEDFSSAVVRDERIVLRGLGTASSMLSRLRLLSIPPSDASTSKRFTLLSDTRLARPGQQSGLEVLLCSLLPIEPSDSNESFQTAIDLSGPDHSLSRLACQNVAADVVPLPASTKLTQHPFSRDGEPQYTPFSYLEYNLSDLVDHAFVAILDRNEHPTPGWLVAEFSDTSLSHSIEDITLRRLVTTGLEVHLPPGRPMVIELQVPSMQSSLLAYDLELQREPCASEHELFAPLLRHYMTRPYESKYFVNVKHVEVSLHGISPFVPPPADEKALNNGLSFQLWTDPTCKSSVTIRLSVDPMASLGKLYMRYRTVFAAFPVLVVAMVLRKQFLVYSSTGLFITFSESIEMCLKRSLPLLMLSLTCLSLSVGHPRTPDALLQYLKGHDKSLPNFGQNDLLTGTADPFFWFLIPMIGLVCIGVCVAVHYLVLVLVYVFSSIYGYFVSRPVWSPRDDSAREKPLPSFTSSTRQRRLITTIVLLCLVSTTVPHQFAFVVACLVQLSTDVRAFWHARDTPSTYNTNFSNYAHSIFLLMFWILPINIPTLVVWIRNLAVHWFMPFSSHHNVLSILPFILLVETMTTGSMIPRVTSPLRHGTNAMLFGVSLFAAIYGVSYTYVLHHLVNLIVAWFVILHITGGRSWGRRQWQHAQQAGDVKSMATNAARGTSTGARSPSLPATDPAAAAFSSSEKSRGQHHHKAP
ncbi:PGAP1-like protein-domain-containing protein [Microdochium trichocladiopsis]|uniref:GPI inositol-deacylase n=1 Tax=Microdochium trichocladiopsis TaxID=1682393 RepID=A0A9P9BTZ6_9PEZI|nr:PGAP1-like protein-domain-containing protein [Microdochium trichocladiopsis]KAH7030949.1 PGAP1-like protein-domain-containing protein [Microdochium trichocladiopsis]